jgi:phosphoglycerate dehydrogenase-like enzyme
MTTLHVLFLGPEHLLTDVRRELPEMRVTWASDRADVVAQIGAIDVVFDASMAIHFDAELLALATQLKYYVTATTGTNHVDESFLAARQVPLRTLRDERPALKNITAAAEHSWLLLLACARQLRPAIAHVLNGEWDRTQFPGMMLNGRTLGIIGCGRIGQWMARYATAFGMRCIGYDQAPSDVPKILELLPLDDVLAASDIVTIHVPLTTETTQLIGEREIGLMRDGVIIVNTSRGEITDEHAILAGLKSRKIGALGTDVLIGEPDTRNHPLLVYARKNDNVVVTPHIGGFSPDALRSVIKLMCGRIRERFAVARV